MNKKALVLLSGGQDSTTCLFWAKEEFDSVEAIGFHYGQRHEYEVELASLIAKNAAVPFYTANISTLNDIAPNALTERDIPIKESEWDGKAPNTMVEGRNMLFITYAGIYAKSKGISNLVLGVSQTDFSNYPDCTKDFIDSAEKTLSLATDYNFTIHTPLMLRTKAETWMLADNLGVLELIKRNTLTCYNGIKSDGCGVCPACRLRKKGWDEFQLMKSESS